MNPDSITEALGWIRRETHLRTRQARMLSDGIQGKFLQAFSLMVRPSAILEIGTFTGYSSVCLSRGLRSGGRLDACEINDELEDVIREGWRRAGLKAAVLHIGDALQTIPELEGPYDIIYIDADKRFYSEYYDLASGLLAREGWILADNVAWGGRVIPGASVNSSLETDHSRRERHDPQTVSLMSFCAKVESDPGVEAVTLPVRDGLMIIHRL